MNQLYQTLKDRHSHLGVVDEEQYAAILSPKSHLIVEAPAGHGKTLTMVSKMAYLISTGQVPYPKKILALTFSVNAAFKIRKDIAQQLPSILTTTTTLASDIAQSVYTTNYHGLCRRILSRHGHHISSKLSLIDSLKGVSINDKADTKERLKNSLKDLNIELTNNETEILIDYTKSINKASDQAKRESAIQYLSKQSNQYLQIVTNKFLPQDCVPFDAILMFTRKLFTKYSQIRSFYRTIFPVIVVDEFQDTNILQWTLLQDLVGRNEEARNKLFIFGDRYQKIYDFIGAMDNIIDEAKSYYDMHGIELKTNHRFQSQQELLQLDTNLRNIAYSPFSPQIESVAKINIIRSTHQEEEAENIVKMAQLLLKNDPSSVIAILTRAGAANRNTAKLVEYFKSKKVDGFSYFFALYSDEDQNYVDFHRKCLLSLYSHQSNSRNFRILCDRIQKDMIVDSPSETWSSLQVLLKTFLSQISIEFRFLTTEEKVSLVIDTLRNNALKQYLMHVTGSQVTLSTVHGSKGLEWDYVIISDMEKNSFPSYPALCMTCAFHSDCRIDWTQVSSDGEFLTLFLQELNVFYVSATRAKKAVYFSYSEHGLNANGNVRRNNISCFLQLPGLQITDHVPPLAD